MISEGFSNCNDPMILCLFNRKGSDRTMALKQESIKKNLTAHVLQKVKKR